MHELSVARSILDIVAEYVPVRDAARVSVVRVKLGSMSGIVADSLTFCFDALAPEAGFPEAHLAIDTVPLTARCRSCGWSGGIEQHLFRCEACDGSDLEVLSGREMAVNELELTERAGEP